MGKESTDLLLSLGDKGDDTMAIGNRRSAYKTGPMTIGTGGEKVHNNCDKG